jgi:5-methylthioadenosine/S-adenosylhomocysteine deaminase
VPAQAGIQFPDYERVALPEHVLIPGLVNAHTQAATALMRGLGERAQPIERAHLSPAFVRDGTALACAEMLRGGITCFGDMYFFPEAALEAALEAGMRAALGLVVIDLPTPYASDPADYLRKGLAVRDRHREQPLASFCLAPEVPLADATLRQVGTLAAELDLPLHMHVHESADEIERSLAEHGVRPLERLRRLGLVEPALMAVHAVHLEEHEIALLARHGCSVAHCPSSNLKLASGFSPIEALRAAEVNLCLGTDSPPRNHRFDLFTEMRIAAMPAHAALRAATLGGARALGLGARIGSIEPGKSADLAAVALRAPELAPCYDPVSNLVYAAGREHVTHVWVGGELRVRDGMLLHGASGLDTRWQIWQNSLGVS